METEGTSAVDIQEPPPVMVDVKPDAGGFDIFTKARGPQTETTDETPIETTPTEQQVEEGETTGEKDEAGATDNKEDVGTTEQPVTKVKRDYSQFDPQDVPLLKKLPNAQFDRFTALIKENKELKAKPPVENKTGLPDNYWSHPEAYKLDPAYVQAETQYGMAQKIAEHWKRQEINVAKNNKVKNAQIVNGELVIGPDVDANEETAVQVDRLLSDARDQLSDVRRNFQDIKSGYTSTYEETISNMRKEEAKFFPTLSDPNHKDYKDTLPLKTKIIEALPVQFRKDPLAETLGKVGVHNALLMHRLNAVEAELKAIKGTRADAKAAPPKKNNFVAGKAGKPALDFDIFAAARQGK